MSGLSDLFPMKVEYPPNTRKDTLLQNVHPGLTKFESCVVHEGECTDNEERCAH